MRIRPAYTLLIHFLILLLMVYGISTLEIRNNDDADLPESDPIVRTNRHFEEVFGSKDRVLISITSDYAYTPEMLESVRDISNEFVGLDWVVGSEIKSLYSAKNITSSKDGLEVKAFYRDDPVDSGKAEEIRRDARENPLIQGHLVSDDEKTLMVVINVVRGSDQASVYEDTYAIIERYRNVGEIRVVGDLVLSEAIDRGIQADASLLIPLALCLQIFMMFVVFRNIRYVTACVIVIATSIIWTMGIMGLLSYQVTVVTTSIPILISVISSSYTIYFVRAFLLAGNGNRSITERLNSAYYSINKAMLVSSVTSAIGAFTLIAFKVSAIADFGVITAIGTITSSMLALTLLPVLLKVFIAGRAGVNGETVGARLPKKHFFLLESLLRKWVTLASRWPVVFLSVIAAITVIAGANLTNLRVGANFADYLPDDNRIRQDMNYFDNELGGSRYFNIMIDAGEENGAQSPDFLRKVEAIQNYAESLSHVGNTLSFVDIVKRIDAVINDSYKGNIPDNSDQISQYLLLYSISSSPDDFSEWVDYDYRRIKIFVPVTTSEQEVHQALYQQLDSYIKNTLTRSEGYEFGGNLVVWLAQMDYIIEGKILNIILSLLFVVVICSIFFRSLVQGVVASLPVIFAVICTFSVMAVLGIRLEVSTAVITAVTVGIGIDFAIHFWHSIRLRLEDGLPLSEALTMAISSTGMSIVFDILSNVIGFSAFILSEFQPVQTFGYLIAFSMLISGMATFTIIPAIMSLLFARITTTHPVNIESDYAENKVQL